MSISARFPKFMSSRFPILVDVAVRLALTHDSLTYRLDEHHLPPNSEPEQYIGSRVLVRIVNKVHVGLIVGLSSDVGSHIKIRAIESILDAQPILTRAEIEFLKDVSAYYVLSIGQISHLALPRDSLTHTPAYTLSPTQDISSMWLLLGLEDILTELRLSPTPSTVQQLRDRLKLAHRPARTLKAIREALAMALQQKQVSLTKVYRLQGGSELHSSAISAPEIATKIASPPDHQRKPIATHPPNYSLNEAQRQSVATITAEQAFKVHLLYGVTGSGKTDVYLRAIEHSLNLASSAPGGKQVLFLVPEISLATQLQRRIEEYLALDAVIFHYRITNARRAKIWRGLRAGDIRVVIGTRSAVFLPFADLGLIVVDEEHSDLYKDRDQAGYHARDVAIWRAKRLQIPVVLGSATPSLTTWLNTKKSHYNLLALAKRVDEIDLPAIEMIDIGSDKLHAGLHTRLLLGMNECLNQGGQVLVYHNSRGYSPAVWCQACRQIVYCHQCAAPMHLHAGTLGRGDYLQCHKCLSTLTNVTRCPKCRATDLTPIGFSTQQIEHALKLKFPNHKCIRFDSDEINSPQKLEETLRDIRDGAVDIVVGTQMLIKGHHFPGIQLVVVPHPDMHLFSNDIFARERLVQDLVQVCGRSGRTKVGKVMMQTHYPNEPLFVCIQQHDYREAITLVATERKLYGLPPFVHLAIFHFSHTNATQAMTQARGFVRGVRAQIPADVRLQDPIISPMPYIRRHHRVQVWFSAPNRRALNRALQKSLAYLKRQAIAGWMIDVDPVDSR